MKDSFEQAYDNYLAGQDIDSTLTDCARFMFEAGVRAATGEQKPFGYFRFTDNGWVDCGVLEEGAKPLYEHPAKIAQGQQEVDNSKVICPSCCNQFRAIPMDVQKLMIDAGFEPPFTTPPAAPDAELVEALKAADEYLSSNKFNEIGSGSILHRQMQDALAKHGGAA